MDGEESIKCSQCEFASSQIDNMVLHVMREDKNELVTGEPRAHFRIKTIYMYCVIFLVLSIHQILDINQSYLIKHLCICVCVCLSVQMRTTQVNTLKQAQ